VNVIVALKLTLVPLLILGISLVQRRWGPAVAGWLSAFPVVSAPILLFIALEQGTQFAARAAAGTLAAVLATLAFALSYAWAATRFTWRISLAAAFGCYAASVACLALWSASVAVVAPIVIAALLSVGRFFPTPPPAAASAATSSDLAWRMAAGAVLVLSLTQFSFQLGAQLSGLLAMFPILSSVLAVFSHRRGGAGTAIRLLHGTVLGYHAFAAFCIVLSLSLASSTIGSAFALALGCAVLIHSLSRIYLLRATRNMSA
jgi:hypothetical protein